jgi:hypothetical protein
VLKYNGTSWVNDSDSGITGSGSAGQVAYFTGATTQGGSNNLFWDSANSRLGVGTNAPARTLDVRTTGLTILNLNGGTSTNQGSSIYIQNGNFCIGDVSSFLGGTPNANFGMYTSSAPFIFYIGATTERARFHATGNFGIGTGATDSGEKLQVTGTMKVTGASNFGGASTYTGTGQRVFLTTGGTDASIWMQVSNAGGSFYLGRDNAAASTFGLANGNVIYGDGARPLGFFTNATLRATLDASGNLGLGVTPSAWGGTAVIALQIGLGTSLYNISGGNGTFLGSNYFFNGTNNIYLNNTTATAYGQAGGQHQWFTAASGTAGNTVTFTQAMTITANGRLLLGTTTEGTQLLQVNGTSNFVGASTFASNITLTTNNTYIYGRDSAGNIPRLLGINSANSTYIGPIDAYAGGEILYAVSANVTNQRFYTGATERMRIDANGSVGIGTTSLGNVNLRVSKTIAGGATAYGQLIDGQIQSTVTSGVYSASVSSTQAASFTLTNLFYYLASQGTFGAGSSVTNQYGFRVQSELIGATNNYGFYGDIASGTGRWNLYMNGTAANYLAGNLGIGVAVPVTYTANARGINILSSTTASEISLRNSTTGNAAGAGLILTQVGVNGFIYNANAGILAFGTSDAERARFTNGGNLLIGSTTDSGEKLQVTGTMRVTGASTFASTLQITSASGTPTTGAGLELAGNTTAGSLTAFNRSLSTFLPMGFNALNYEFYTSSNLRFSIANSGAATFTSSGSFGNTLQIAGGTTAPTSGAGLELAGGSTTGAITSFNRNLGTYLPIVLNTLSYSFLTSGTEKFAIANSGAATFSSSVTSASLNINAGTQLSGFRGTLSSPNAGQIYYATDNSGWQLSIGKLVSTTYTAQMVFKDNATVTTTSDFILAGGYGLDFINGSGTTVTAMRSTAGGASILSTTSTGTHIVVGTEVAGDFILASNNTERIRLSSSGFFSQLNATNPSSSITDSYIQYSADVVAGNAAPHFRTENGAVIKLYQETTAVGNSIISLGGGSAVLDDTTFDGYTLRQIVKALRNQGILQ